MTPVAGQAATREHLLALIADRTPLADEGSKKMFRTKSVYVGATEQQVNDSLDFILYEDDSLAPFVEKLMTTGSTAAREMVKGSFSETVNSIARVIDERDSDPEWDAMVPYPEQIMESLLREWNIGNVADECGIAYSRKSLNSAAVSAQFISARNASVDEVPDEVYWRGVAVLTLSESVSFASSSGEVRAFIKWAGEQQDLSEAVRVIGERRTINPDTIAGLLSQANIEKPLRDGLL